ncbi:MAG: preprotein translocase subunit SecG [Candidatus Methylacidiphilales bacterium]
MNILIYAITAILVLCCLLLIGVVLLQRPRSEGLGTAFGGGMTESMFGAGTSDVLTKITIWMAAAFFICTLLLAVLMSHRDQSPPSILEQHLQPVAPLSVPETSTSDSAPAESLPETSQEPSAETSPAPTPEPAAQP